MSHALALYRLATDDSKLLADDTSRDVRKGLLEESVKLAKEAVDEFEANPIAHLAGGWSELALGLLGRLAAPHEQNDEAEAHFANAKTKLARAHELLITGPKDKSVEALAARVQAVVERLQSPEWFLAEVRRETLRGRPDNAYMILHQASLRHRNKGVWMAMLQAGIRSARTQPACRQCSRLLLQLGSWIQPRWTRSSCLPS